MENTTRIKNEDYNILIRSIPSIKSKFLSAIELESKMFGLYLYFNDDGLQIGEIHQQDGLIRAERMPVLPGECDNVESAEEQAKCTETNMIMHIQRTVQYPDIAKVNGHQGKVFLTFVINETGYISDVEILKGVSPEVDNAAINAVKLLPRFTPAEQRGTPVKLKYTIPVNFRLR